MTLHCIPCGDNVFAFGEGKIKSEISQSSSNREPLHSDACAPFCTCSCCAGFSIHQYSAVFNYTPVSGVTYFSSYAPGDLIEVSLPIWQPPQL
ncbi:MAG: hypothetical protein JST17_13375 [Bacteroidetes bacterium]|nr:hypothetical protein [Bacteroidota bacterium]MBS1930992.1 hypothetical protein [Bacteroidota bacterium]